MARRSPSWELALCPAPLPWKENKVTERATAGFPISDLGHQARVKSSLKCRHEMRMHVKFCAEIVLFNNL